LREFSSVGATESFEEDVEPGLLRRIFGAQTEAAVLYHDMLAGRGVEWGLIGPREADRLWSRHILNSAVVQELIPEGATVLDVGSGAGLPGIPLALARPDLRVTLMDSLLRRVNFLELAIAELELTDRVDVVRARAEDTQTRSDVVVARAVAPLGRLAGWCGKLIGSSLLAIKGDGAWSEVAEAEGVLKKLGLASQIIEISIGQGLTPTVVIKLTRLR